MPFQTLLPALYPNWDLGDVGWPTGQAGGVGTLGTQVTASDDVRKLYEQSLGLSTAPAYLTLMTGGGGFLRPVWSNQHGVVCLVTNAGAFPCGMYFGQNYVFYGPLVTGGLSVELPEPYAASIHVVFVRWLVAAPAITAEDKPILFLPTDGGAVTNVVITGIAGAQYGIRGTGGAGLEFFSSIGGVQQEAVALTWPETDFRNWVKITAEHLPATPTASARFNLYLDDALVIARNWDAGTTLPDFSDAVAGTGCMMRSLFHQDVGSPQFALSFFRSREGAFDATGLLV